MTVLNTINRKLYIWVNQMLYLGISPVSYREHAIVSDKLIVSLEGTMEITLDNGDKITSRTCLVKAGINFKKTNINTNNAVMAIYFIAPITQDFCALESIMSYARNGVHYNHPEEDVLINSLLKIRNTSINPEKAFIILRKLIVEIIIKIKNTVNENISLKRLADDVNLSESRLEKLFKDQIGIPITKYRLKYRVFIGIIHLALGRSITEAALAAGFASSSHFSKSFSAINGIPPSTTFLKQPFLNVLLADEVLKKVDLTNKQAAEIKNTTPKRIQLGEYNEYLITGKI
jgi:AraC-like DNA-binding protein